MVTIVEELITISWNGLKETRILAIVARENRRWTRSEFVQSSENRSGGIRFRLDNFSFCYYQQKTHGREL